MFTTGAKMNKVAKRILCTYVLGLVATATATSVAELRDAKERETSFDTGTVTMFAVFWPFWLLELPGEALELISRWTSRFRWPRN